MRTQINNFTNNYVFQNTQKQVTATIIVFKRFECSKLVIMVYSYLKCTLKMMNLLININL